MIRFRLRLTLTILGLISLVLILLGIYFAKVLERSYLQTLDDLLRRESRLIAQSIHAPEIFSNSVAMNERVGEFAPAENVRVTVINQNGRVLFDSSTNPDKMENHAHRPEFAAALQGQEGVSRRFSATLGYDMVYIAVPVKQGEQVVGAVRSSISMEEITGTIHNMWYSLLTGLLITVVLGFFVVSRIAQSITRPIEEITRVARNITQREYESRVKLQAKDEIGQLADAINFMASSLEQQMYEISENQQRLTGVLTNMASGVLFITEHRRIMLVNPAVERLLGTSSRELVGKLHIEAGKSFGLSQYIDHCIDSREKFREEVHIYYPQERILDVNFAPYINFKGEAKGVVVVIHDITDIRKLEKMRAEFLTNVSHELRTPITSIKGFTETLLDGAMQDEETCRNFLHIIYDESERLHRLIRDILDLSKIQQRNITLTMERHNVNELLTATLSLVQERMLRKNLTLTKEIDQDLWLVTDRDCFHQIMLNLVANAIAYTPENGSIMLSAKRTGDALRIKVTDTGIGIPEKDLERIFERFYRVDKARSRDSGGTGLGLAIVKHLIETLHGKITVDSVEGVGTTFTVIFPISQ